MEKEKCFPLSLFLDTITYGGIEEIKHAKTASKKNKAVHLLH